MTSSQHPVVRMWSGHVPSDRADAFREHLIANAVSEIQEIEGFLEATVLRRAEGDRARFTLLTTWTDYEAVRRFAGDDTQTARTYPGDEQFDLIADLDATHHELNYQVRSGS